MVITLGHALIQSLQLITNWLLSTYSMILSEIAILCLRENAYHIIVGGDFNTDFSKENLSNVQMLRHFLRNECLESCVDSTISSVDYAYYCQINGSKSLIDHFFISRNLFTQLRSYKVLYEGDNLSDHSAVSMQISFSQLQYSEVNSELNSKSYSLSWESGSDLDIYLYQTEVTRLLDSMNIPSEAFTCKNLSCKKHNEAIIMFYNEFINVHIEACVTNIPVKVNGEKEHYTWVNEEVSVIKETAMFWHDMWRMNGSPHQGIVADIGRKTRSKYHYAVHALKRREAITSNYCMTKAVLNNKSRNFWSEIKKKIGGKKSYASVIDNACSKQDICDLFFSKYMNLYTSVPYDNTQMQLLNSNIEKGMLNNCVKCLC